MHWMNKVLSIAHSTVFHIKDNPFLLCSAAIKFHNMTNSNISYRSSTDHGLKFLHTGKTENICHAQDSNYITATHNTTHSHCTSTYQHTPSTTHPPAFHNPSAYNKQTQSILCISGSMQRGTRCRGGVKVLWCHSHLVCLVLGGSIPTCACFHSETFSWTSSK